MRNPRRVDYGLQQRQRSGFTLVEVLGAVTIVGVLAAVIMAVSILPKGRCTGPHSRAELAQMQLALEVYKVQFGEYPPDGSNVAAFQSHMQQRFPKIPAAAIKQLPPPAPDTAIYFWLAGPQGKGWGWFDGSILDANTVLFDFDDTRLKQVSPGKMQYLPRNGKADSDPYVYFSSNGSYNPAGVGNAKPYVDKRQGAKGVFCNPVTFQLLSPGRDGKYGGDNQYPLDPITCKSESLDDMANFNSGADMQADIPK
jgi:prepilin-type N-terminal cleavage/methylation domain-containing protein